jgi:hypothetical protein
MTSNISGIQASAKASATLVWHNVAHLRPKLLGLRLQRAHARQVSLVFLVQLPKHVSKRINVKTKSIPPP